MKKREQKFSTEHFDAVLVTHEPERADYQPVGVGLMAETPNNYLLLGPPDGPLARIEGIEVALLYTLLDHVGGGPRKTLLPPGCGG